MSERPWLKSPTRLRSRRRMASLGELGLNPTTLGHPSMAGAIPS